MNNKKTGTRFEKDFAALLAKNWFWVHLFQDNKNGQPCDVIAARNGRTYIFDCKNCENDFFDLNRIEENQYNAMQLFRVMGNAKGMFAIRYPDGGIYLLDFDKAMELKTKDFKRINQTVCRNVGRTLTAWFAEQDAEDDKRGERIATDHWQ